MKKLILILFILLAACDRREIIPTGVPVSKSLLEYINEKYYLDLKTTPVAFAARNQTGFLSDTLNSISVIFMPSFYSAENKYFETNSINVDTGDFSLFNEKSIKEDSLFNGYIMRFIRGVVNKDIWCRTTYTTNHNK